MPSNKSTKLQPSNQELMSYFASPAKKRVRKLLPGPGQDGAPVNGVWLLKVTEPTVIKIEKEESEFNGAEYIEFQAVVVDDASEYSGWKVRHSFNFFDEEAVSDTRYQFEQILGDTEWGNLVIEHADGTPHDLLEAICVALDGEFFAGTVGQTKAGKRNGVAYQASNRIYDIQPSDQAVGQASLAGF